MRNRLAGVLLCLSIAGTLFAAPAFQQNRQNEWKEYSYASDGFAVSAPSVPIFSKQDKPTAAGTVELHNYAIELGNNSGVMISSTQFENAKDLPPKPLLQGAKNGAIGGMKARLTSEKEIMLDGYPGVQFEAENDNFHMRSRMYIVKGRLLTLLAIAPTGIPIPDDANRIFNSLKLLKNAIAENSSAPKDKHRTQ
jgi:hypothetical protein